MAEKRWNAQWDGFKPGRWNRTSVNVRNFILENYTPYDGDDSFLVGPTEATTKLWEHLLVSRWIGKQVRTFYRLKTSVMLKRVKPF